MAGKNSLITTSAGYRIPVSSEYHQRCIAPAIKVIREAVARSNTDKTFLLGDYRKCNAVARENLWKEYVRNEIRAAKDWGKDWGFLLEYDYEGNPQQKKELPDNLSYYGSTFPITASQHVGGWGQHPETVKRIERTMCHKKTKTDLEHYYDY